MPRLFPSAWGRARVVIVLLSASTAAALPATASAHSGTHISTPQAHIAIVGPQAHFVKGAVPFVAHFAGKPIRKVVFSVDGHRKWTTARRPFRYRNGGRLNTRKLRNGVHVLSVKGFFSHHRVAVAKRRIDVRNPTKPSKAGPTAPTVPAAFGPPAGGVPGPSVANFNRETYQYSSSLSISQEANRYQVLVLQSTDGPKVAALKAANPNLKIFVYQHPWFSRVGDPHALGVCTSYPSDSLLHPSWFLHDTNGKTVPYSMPGNYEMDIGNPAYQQACIQNAISLAKKWGFDGVFWDGLGPTLTWELPRGTKVPEYSSNASWQNANYSFITTASAALHAAGLEDIGNLCGMTLTPGLWQKWSAPLDGSEEESWTDGGLGLAQQDSAWKQKLANVAWDEANGKYSILHSYNSTQAGNTFGLASMLLVTNGRASYSTSNTNYTSNESSFPEFTTAQQLGAPAGPYSQLSNGIYERAFSNGIVLVNPTNKSVGQFSLGGGIYSGSQVTSATRTGLGPNSSLILLKVG
jgi:hypothetical protein